MTIEEAKSEFGTFEELTEAQNKQIHLARSTGFAEFFPVGRGQGSWTLKAAQKWNRRKI